jgi:hypothetical protein
MDIIDLLTKYLSIPFLKVTLAIRSVIVLLHPHLLVRVRYKIPLCLLYSQSDRSIDVII